MDNLPIDIHSNKLLDWLISRRHCKKNWQELMTPIREKIGHAIRDMPENEKIVALLQASYISYFHCKKIVEILKETEKDTKNIFGYYSSQRMKDWQEIISLYEKDSVYLAEAAQFLQRFIQYEIPTLRKQILKAESGIKDAERKEEEYTNQSVSAQRFYKKELDKLEITGVNVRRELLQLTTDLPKFVVEMTSKIHKLQPIVDYFMGFRRYMMIDNGTITNTDEDEVLPLLRHLIQRFPDQVTTYEWKYKEIPDEIEPPNCDELINENTENADDDDEIDFGDDPNEINFDIEVVGDIKEIEPENDFLAAAISRIARGHEAFYLLENIDTLVQVVTELQEVTHSTMKEWLKQVEDVISELDDPQRKPILKIRSSFAYVDELAHELEVKKLAEQKYKRLAQIQSEKQDNCSAQFVKSQQLLDNMIEAAKTLQENIESEISKRYNNREVYIMGEINAVLYGS